MQLEAYLRNKTNNFYQHALGKEFFIILMLLEAYLRNNTNDFYQLTKG